MNIEKKEWWLGGNENRAEKNRNPGRQTGIWKPPRCGVAAKILRYRGVTFA